MMTRRDLLQSSLQFALAALLPAAAGTAFAADAASCADSSMDQGLAASLHYTEQSPDPAKPCAGCGFFSAGGGCGSCAIFNSKVNSKGHCDSWAAKG